MGEITITEAKKLREQLQKDITKLLIDFSNKTSLYVDSVSLTVIPQSDGSSHVMRTELNIKL